MWGTVARVGLRANESSGVSLAVGSWKTEWGTLCLQPVILVLREPLSDLKTW